MCDWYIVFRAFKDVFKFVHSHYLGSIAVVFYPGYVETTTSTVLLETAGASDGLKNCGGRYGRCGLGLIENEEKASDPIEGTGCAPPA